MLKRGFVMVLWMMSCSPLLAETAKTKPATRPVEAIEHVMVVSIDGGRPDLILRANCPTIRGLMAEGSYTFWARTTAVALTLPSHVSMMTGVIPVRHGIHWNEDLPFSTPYWPKVPTLFEVAHKSGYTTAMVTAKPKFDILAKPGTIDWGYMPGEEDLSAVAATPMEKQSTKKSTAGDDTVVEHAAEILKDHRPDVMLIHFASSDVAGHGHGWGSPEQMAAIEHIDLSLGKILKGMDPDVLAHTAIIVSADHGGAGGSHGADDMRSRHIPWILSGPGIRKNYDLTRIAELEVNTYDTFATACYLLSIPIERKIDGKPIVEAIEGRQLLH